MDHAVTVLEILRHRPVASRAELIELSGLSPATISRAVGALKREGLIRERSAGPGTPGRPPRVVELRPEAAHVLGIDAGGTRVRAVLADLEGTVRASATGRVGSARHADAILETIARVADDVRARSGVRRVLAAAAGISGIVDQAAGRVLLSPDLPGLEGLDVASRLERALRVPVGIDNDDLLAAVGEASLGAARGCSDVAFLSLGYGLGAGLVMGGRPVRGARGAAGAIAYLVPGKLEDRASGRVIPKLYLERAGRSSARMDAKRVFRLAAEGDAEAIAVVHEVIEALGELVVNVATLLDPEVLVIGGGLAGSGATLLDPLAARLRDSVPFAPRLVTSQLGEDAVACGAAVMALALAKQHLAHGGRAPGVRAEPTRIGALKLA